MAAVAAVLVFGLLGERWRQEASRAAPPPVLVELPDFFLVERSGRVVTKAELAGRPWVADFIFTRCGLSCPRMTLAMQRLQAVLPPEGVRLISVSVDPAYDRPEVLRTYADGYGIRGEDWWFLTGEPEAVMALCREGFKLSVSGPGEEAADPREPILHSTRFVLVDARARIRGYYDGAEAAVVDRLVRDVQALR